MLKKWFLVGMMFLLVPWLLVGCGISQEVYDAVVAERDSFVANLQSVQSELDAAKSKLQSIESELEDMNIELESVTGELGTTKSEVESAQSELTAKESELQSVESELESVKAELEEALTQLIEAQAPVAPPPPTVAGQTYTNSEYGFSCDFPEGWTAEEGVGQAVLFAGSTEGEYGYMVNISIGVEELPVRWELDEYVRMSEVQAKSAYPDWTVVQQYESTVGGVPSIVQVVTVEAMGYPLKDAFAFFMKGTTAYVIGLDITEDLYEQYRDEFALVITTFKFD